jgi:hypothetical protein
MHRVLRSALVVATLSAAALAATTPAFAAESPVGQAAPQALACYAVYQHSSSGSLVGEGVYCTGTTSQYRAQVVCEDELRGSTNTFYGPWVSSPDASGYRCPDEGGVQWTPISVKAEF